jgi:hypothetical protein
MSSTAGAVQDSETQESAIHLDSSRMVGFGTVATVSGSIRAGTVVQPMQSVKPITIVCVH